MCARLLLDPGSSAYYLSTALLAIAAADLMNVRTARRLGVALIGLWLLPCLSMTLVYGASVRALALAILLASYGLPQVDRIEASIVKRWAHRQRLGLLRRRRVNAASMPRQDRSMS
jgi:hypothetical protein